MVNPNFFLDKKALQGDRGTFTSRRRKTKNETRSLESARAPATQNLYSTQCLTTVYIHGQRPARVT